MKEVPLISALNKDLEILEEELNTLYKQLRDINYDYTIISNRIEEALLVRIILMNLKKFYPPEGFSLVELPTNDPILTDFLEERGYGNAADILRKT